MKHFSDEDLVEEIRAGSHVAFGVLMKRYERVVYRIGFYYAKQPEHAMDITQNVFLKTYEKLALYQGHGFVQSLADEDNPQREHELGEEKPSPQRRSGVNAVERSESPAGARK